MKHRVGSRFKNAATKGGSVPETSLKASKGGKSFKKSNSIGSHTPLNAPKTPTEDQRSIFSQIPLSVLLRALPASAFRFIFHFSFPLSQFQLYLSFSPPSPALPMHNLAQTLAMTTPVSTLLRKARRLGLHGVDALIALAVARGCHHYASDRTPLVPPPSEKALGDDELTILLLVGENAYEPTTIRCAAQLARSPRVTPAKLVRLAVMEKCERVLAHIARAGLDHDLEGRPFWQALIDQLPATSTRPEPDLPHWSRFVSMPGRQRFGIAPTRWLVPDS